MNESPIKPVVDIAPPPLPRFQGAMRFQAALDGDGQYRLLVAGVLIVAGLAGAGFGGLVARAGEVGTLFWSLTAAGLVVRSIGRREGQPPRFGTRAVLLLTATCLLFSTAASFATPAVTLRLAGAAALVGAVLWLATRRYRFASWVALSLLTALGGAAGYRLAGGSIGAIAGGAAIVAVSAISTFRSDSGIEPVIAATRATGLGWALLAWGGAASGEIDRQLAVIALAMVVALDVWTERRQSFAAVVAAALFLQLATLPPAEQLVLSSLWLQPLCSLVVFAAAAVAGWRFVAAAQLLQPLATYRILPLCVVPRLDRGLDHPVKISVV